MTQKHYLRINVADRNGEKQELLTSRHLSVPKKLLTIIFGEFLDVLVIAPSNNVHGIKIKEMELRGAGNE